ncbi:hypothetical protein CXB51_002110 [Gossypium anomalum]|uniref:Proton gradient regulation 5 n=1 Tax=Gossypium anomalum TaxID=47600 RepID=A0A8J5ZMY4_9ROSI|nr:hypothetical protein CXB51_002110 [Gossypium anomalum]
MENNKGSGNFTKKIFISPLSHTEKPCFKNQASSNSQTSLNRRHIHWLFQWSFRFRQRGLGTSFYGSWGSSSSPDSDSLVNSVPSQVRVGKPVRSKPMMKNVNEGKGLFAPLVVLTRQIIGKKRFNQLRGKAIALHSQVITEFCKSIGADAKQRQGLIRLAKKNGERLGFLA